MCGTFSQTAGAFSGGSARFFIVPAVFGEKKPPGTLKKRRGAMGKPFSHCQNVPAHC
jgi:hypothetical protein